MATLERIVIGRNTRIDFGKRAAGVPAKIDTGADGSAVWASNIRVDKDGVLKFSLFGEGSPYYNGKTFRRTDYSVAMVKSASGHEIIKYRTHFTVRLGGRKMKVLFGLSDRSNHTYPVLIGRRTLQGKFVVDVGMNEIESPKRPQTANLNKELAKNPHKFYKKYHKPKEEAS